MNEHTNKPSAQRLTLNAERSSGAIGWHEMGKGRVWLQHRDGEGAEFGASEVEAVHPAQLEAYFWQNF